jgi:hypothetical protein
MWTYLLRGTTSVRLLAVVGSLGAGWYFSEKLLKPSRSQKSGYDIEVFDFEAENVALSTSDNARRNGTYGLEGTEGYGQVGKVLQEDMFRITREFHPMWGTLKPGDARLDSYAFPHNPERAYGMKYQEIQVSSEFGELPAWYVEGTKNIWMIFIHGRGAERSEGLRILPTIVEQGFPSLIITYRNDPEAPKSLDGLYHLGQTEWRDLEAAADYAFTKGAQDLLLVGCSMGGTISPSNTPLLLSPVVTPKRYSTSHRSPRAA